MIEGEMKTVEDKINLSTQEEASLRSSRQLHMDKNLLSFDMWQVSELLIIEQSAPTGHLPNSLHLPSVP